MRRVEQASGSIQIQILSISGAVTFLTLEARGKVMMSPSSKPSDKVQFIPGKRLASVKPRIKYLIRLIEGDVVAVAIDSQTLPL